MEINIRQANINDLNAILKLNNELFRYEESNFSYGLKLNWQYTKEGEEYFINKIENDFVIVAEIDNSVVGYLAGNLNANISYINFKTAEIDNMCVDTNYRKIGVGKGLIKVFKETCKENNIERILVTATSQNSNAIEFYKSNGFADYNTTLKIDM